MHPRRPRLKSGPDPGYQTLTGKRITHAKLRDDNGKVISVSLEDWFDIPKGSLSLEPSEKVIYDMLHSREWTGVTEFPNTTQRLADIQEKSTSSIGEFVKPTNAGPGEYTNEPGTSSSSRAALGLKSTELTKMDIERRRNVDVVGCARDSLRGNDPSKPHGDVMSETLINPCLQECEHEQYQDMYTAIEYQRSRLEELACFEREVDARVREA